MLDVLKTRRSVRKYTDEMPRDEDIERIVEAGLYAPTGMGRQGVKFVVVKLVFIEHLVFKPFSAFDYQLLRVKR